MTMPPTVFQRPAAPALAKVFDEALRRNQEIRYADETRVVTFERNRLGCLGLILVIALATITLGIALLFGVLSLGDKSGIIREHTLQPNGKVKTRQYRGK
jgi:hypothetical protein